MNSMGEFFQRDQSAHPPALTPFYKSSILRSPRAPLLSLQNSLSEVTGPVFRVDELGPLDNDLIANYAHGGEPIGERTIIHGRVLEENGRGVPNTLVEIWQANAGGRYRHKNDTYLAPVDPNFGGCGRAVTDETGRYAFYADREARRLSLPQLCKFLATRPRALLAVRFRLRAAADHANVFRGRSANSALPNRLDDPGPDRG
ncbi:hypothetical protein ACVWZV_001138 [Bradyrhizobium sp. GM5.1]